MAIQFRLAALNVPPGLQCLTTMQGVLNASAQYLQVVGPEGVTVLVMADVAPSVDDRDKAWLQLEANGKPEGFFKWQTDEWILVPGVHKGTITLFSGAVADIPDGWQLPDGTQGSPDLTSNTDFDSIWKPTYGGGVTTYDLCPIWFRGLQAL